MAKFRLTRLVFFRARPVNRGTPEHPRMSKGYLQPLVLFFLLFYFGVTFVHANLCQPANFYNYSKKELQRKTIFFPQFPAGIELSTSEFEDQCLIHWTTAVSLEYLRQKLIFNCQACSQGPRIFSRWRPLLRVSSKFLRPVSVMLATATPQSPAMKRPLENLEL